MSDIINLLHLKIACYLYNQFTNYDDSYLELSKKYSSLDLTKSIQIKALIEWLRAWRCRQFKVSDEKLSTESIMDWYTSKELKIPNTSQNLIEYDLTNNKGLIIEIFNDLSARKASTRQRGSYDVDICIGPVGTAKILFALRPNLFSPWDTPIYTKLQLAGDGSGYIDYLAKIQEALKSIKNEIKSTNTSWDKLFEYLEKKHNSYPKLIDEYYWVAITKKCDPSVIEKFVNTAPS